MLKSGIQDNGNNTEGGQLVYIDVHPTPSAEKCNRPPEESHYSSNSNRWLHEPCANWLNRFSKFVNVKRKHTHGFFMCLTTLPDNGGEFRNKNMENLCKRHKIKFVHGAPRNPSTQGQVERNNSTIKVSITNIVRKRDSTKSVVSSSARGCLQKKYITA